MITTQTILIVIGVAYSVCSAIANLWPNTSAGKLCSRIALILYDFEQTK